jgi:hypothetical protein
MKLCIVAHFDSWNYFQWLIALEKCGAKLGIEVKSINASPVHKRVHNDFKNDPYWNPIKEADVVFCYMTRRSTRHEPTGISWWTLPQFVKPFMKPEAKMIAQWDDEFLWLFDPNGMWWDQSKEPNPDNHGGPEQFFKDTGILEIPDGHFVVTKNSPYQKYTTKPVFKMLLPQLCRYKLGKYSENHVKKNIVIMLHSTLNSSISHVLDNVIRPQNYAVTIFNGTLNRDFVKQFREREKLPVNSEVFERLNAEPYMDLLWRNNSIGLDDNAGYGGWSRFAMECAVAYIPCIGSTESVEDIFPELHTAPRDYKKQIELIERLKTDKNFYHEMVVTGRKRLLELLDDLKLCKEFLDCLEKIGVSKTQLTFDKISPFSPEYKPDKNQAHPHP